MKKLFFAAFAIILALTTNAQAPSVKKGTKLTYHVTTADREYDYVVTVSNFGATIAFDWKMTDPVNTSGKINITANALAKATVYKNYFEDDSKVTLTKESTVWLSKKNFNELKSKGKTKMNMTGELATYDKEATLQDASYQMNGQSKTAKVIKCQFIKAADTQFTIQVFNDAKNPLIQYMDLGTFTITLKSVE